MSAGICFVTALSRSPLQSFGVDGQLCIGRFVVRLHDDDEEVVDGGSPRNRRPASPFPPLVDN